MTQTIQVNNPNLLTLNDSTAIYFTLDDFLQKDDTLIIQDGRKSETHWNVSEVSTTQSKAIKSGYSIANLSLKIN